MFIQGFLATVLSTGKDCIPTSAAIKVQPGVLCRIFRPVYKLIGISALLLAQAGDLSAGERAEGEFIKFLPLTVLPWPFGAPADRRAGEESVLSD